MNFKKIVSPKALTVIKYAFSIAITFWAFKLTENWEDLLISFTELSIIVFISNFLVVRNRWLGFLFNSLFMFLYYVEKMVQIFGGTYLTLVMLTNIDSLSTLSGNAGLYISATLFVIILAILPISEITFPRFVNASLLLVFLMIEMSVLATHLVSITPFVNYYQVFKEYQYQQKLIAEVSTATDVTGEFYRDGIDDYYSKDDSLVKQPNVVIVFVEGLSQSVIDSQENLMPNVKRLQEESIDFVNYYNHTFATYRGLSGQLYSGYQLQNYDSNSLIGLQDIFRNQGYRTTFINTEPHNSDFKNYLENFNFDNVISSKINKGMDGSTTDREAYRFLYDEMVRQDKFTKPFFISMYTFGTHLSLDSTDKVYKDGKNSLFNKFFDSDYQIGKFLEKFNSSELAKNTILIFTTDHATYTDAAYIEAWKSRAYPSFDKVPFILYHKGVQSKKVDARGRNSLDFAPTILDFLDITAPNYFLGNSLFSDEPYSKLSYLYVSEGNYMTSQDNVINFLTEDETADYEKIVKDYYTAKLQQPNLPKP
ncbi:LTA synthase family protein [Streptococcus sp. S784/96/1]|uniref:LTA synthase family protein n=1 Tax=Streptococcus sp. S784/96/1 TaxID=2653499 RepID=UPI0013867620|nr:sulfatase-like hydrolase/transferase [Streptococcus sp. S784/96/1]